MMKLQDFYDTGYHDRRHAALIKSDILYVARASVEKWLYFRDVPATARVFDFGCGIGQSIALLPNACGWDLSRESREISRARGIKVFEALSDVPSGAFDIVFSRHTLEHVVDPERYLEDARRFAGTAGRLRLIVPARERRSVTTSVDVVNMHLYCWTPQTIVNLLDVAGWRAEQVAYTPYGGYTKMLPVYRGLGPRAYRLACQATARLIGARELTVTASKR